MSGKISIPKIIFGLLAIVFIVILVLILFPNKKAKIEQLLEKFDANQDIYTIMPEIPDIKEASIKFTPDNKWQLVVHANKFNLSYSDLSSNNDILLSFREVLLDLRKKYE